MHQEVNIIGRKPVFELMSRFNEKIKIVYVVEGINYGEEIGNLLTKVKTLLHISREEFLEKFQKLGNHQWIAAVVNQQTSITIEELLKRSLSSGCGVILALDQVQDPQNLGAILRLAAASGIDGIIIPTDRSAPVTDAARRVSAGASEIVPQCVVKNFARALEIAKSNGFWIIGSDLSEKSENLFSKEALTPCVIVIGSEGKGIRELTRKLCDVLIKIPVLGFIDSLNVSQAASVIIYEYLRKLKKV